MALPGRILIVSPTPSWPLDHGNRKRVHQVASALKARGHEIHFLYYPAEFDWESHLPHRAWRAMQQQWDSVHLAPVTRSLHPPAKGAHHDVDEWWDEALGDYLDWLFRVERFDAVLVNYIWLSRVFDHVPSGVPRILDTHDRVGGRKELLASLGLPPQFFYTTPEAECAALERADIALAIKEEEARIFRAGCAPSVEIVTLPYAETKRVVERSDSAPTLRLGLMGAANSLNRISTRALLDALLTLPPRDEAPWRVVVGGAMAEDFRDCVDPRVTVMGRVEDIAEFYAACDCLVMPLAQSTGQKIRVGEALAYGMPIVAHAHAFEGYPPTDPMHGLTDLQGIVDAIEALAQDPARLVDLARASARSSALQDALVGAALDRIEASFAHGRPVFIVAIDDALLRSRGAAWLRLGAVVAMLAARGRVLIWAPQQAPLGEGILGRLAMLAQRAQIVLPPSLVDAVEGAMKAGEGGLAELVARARPACVWGVPGLAVAGARLVHDADLVDGQVPGFTALQSRHMRQECYAPLLLSGPGTRLWRMDNGRPVVWVVGAERHRHLLPDIAAALAPWVTTPLLVWGMGDAPPGANWQARDRFNAGAGLDRPQFAILLEPALIDDSLPLELIGQAGCGCVVYDPKGGGRHPAVAANLAGLLGWLRLAAAVWPVEGMRRPRLMPLLFDPVNAEVIDRLLAPED